MLFSSFSRLAFSILMMRAAGGVDCIEVFSQPAFCSLRTASPFWLKALMLNPSRNEKGIRLRFIWSPDGRIYRELGTKYRDKYFLSTLGFQFVGCCRGQPTSSGKTGSPISAPLR